MANLFADVACFLVALGLCTGQLYDLCSTPRDAQGECKPISKCTSLLNILYNRPIKSSDADYLRRSQCGFEGTLPKVCCPLEEQVSSITSKPTQKPVTDSPAEIPLLPTENPLLPTHEECGADTQDKIYGGEQTDLTDFPWMALIEYQRDNGKTGFHCAGVLINKRYVLTAAHCLKGKDLPRTWKLIGVRLGEYNTDTDVDCITIQGVQNCAPPPLNIPVEERIAHEEYDPFDKNQYNDIALLRLARDVKYSGYVRPVCLPITAEDQGKNFTGKKLTVAGWGKTETRSESNIKLKLNVQVKSNEDCTSTYSQANVNLNGGQLCAGGEKGKDSCRGDSGGPLMGLYPDSNGEINWYSVGVVSFGPSPCGMENWPGVYTKVANYVPWIVSKLKK